MRIIERSELREEGAPITLQNRLRGTLRYGMGWFGQMQSQEVVSDHLGRSLPNEFVLIRNLLIPDTGLIASLVLIGPQGVFAIHPSGVKGVFRAKDAEWLSHSSGRFRAARPNLQQVASATADVLLQYFRRAGLDLPQVEPVLAFTDAAAHVDTVHPETRIVLADAIEHFAGNIRGRPPIMDGEDVQLLVNALLHPPEPAPAPEPEAPRPAKPLPPPPHPVDAAGPFQLDERKLPPPPRRRRARLQRRQRLLLIVMVAVEACVLVVFAGLILLPTLLG